jgi:hypothetical protein
MWARVYAWELVFRLPLVVPRQILRGDRHRTVPNSQQQTGARLLVAAHEPGSGRSLTTARAVLRDVETGRQAEAMRQALGQLGQEMTRFETRLRKLCGHTRQANEDAEQLRRLGTELSRRFRTIESGEAPADDG